SDAAVGAASAGAAGASVPGAGGASSAVGCAASGAGLSSGARATAGAPSCPDVGASGVVATSPDASSGAAVTGEADAASGASSTGVPVTSAAPSGPGRVAAVSGSAVEGESGSASGSVGWPTHCLRDERRAGVRATTGGVRGSAPRILAGRERVLGSVVPGGTPVERRTDGPVAEPRAREERDRRDDEEAAVDPHVAHGLAGHEHVAAGTLEGQELHHDDPPDAETEETGQPAPGAREDPRGEDGQEREHDARAD